MYDILIVDDEPAVTRGLRRKIGWEELGVRVAGTASDGIDALEIIREHQPDILLTDIRMAVMDGLALLETVRENWPGIRTIILSGHDEFSYAKKALELHADNYLLKPVSRDDLTAAIREVVNRLSTSRKEQNRIAANNQLVVKHSLRNLVEGNLDPAHLAAIEELHPDLKGFEALFIEAAAESRDMAMIRKIDGILSDNHIGYCFSLSGGSLGIAVFSDPEWEPKGRQRSLSRLINRLKTGIDSCSREPCFLAVGSMEKGLDGLVISAGRARTAFAARLIRPRDSVIRYESIAAGRPVPQKGNPPSRKRDGSIKNLRRELDTVISERPGDPDVYRNTLFELSVHALHLVDNVPGTPDRLPGISELWNRIVSSREAETIESYLSQILDRIEEILSTNNKSEYSQVVERVMDTIAHRYMKDLSLKEIAVDVGLTPNYLSALLKKETGASFKNLLMNRRIEIAREYLQYPEFRIYDVAYFVGYQDENYFSRIFKIHCECTPREYRNRIGMN